MLSPDLQRIEHIRHYCEEIEKTVARYGRDFSVFDADADYQRSVSFSILQIGELSARLSDEYKLSTAESIHWAPIKGMRNMVAHSYGSMSREVIWQTVMKDIPVLCSFCEEQLRIFKHEEAEPKEEYDIKSLNPRKNPFTGEAK